MATAAPAGARALTFEQKMTGGMALFILFGFGQFAARGFVDYAQVPVIFHLHGGTMVAWLGLLVTQSFLAGSGNLSLHRSLGWLSVVMVPLIVILGSATCVTALRAGIFPPFFTGPYFLALVHVSVLFFGAMMAAAIWLRRNTPWHKRLILGSTILLLEPALGRVLPMPLIMPWGEWLSMAIQLGVAWLILRDDSKTIGFIHPASKVVVAAIVLSHVGYEVLARVPAWQQFTASVITA